MRPVHYNDHVLSFIVRGGDLPFYRWLLASLGIEASPRLDARQLERLLPPEWGWEGPQGDSEKRRNGSRAGALSRHQRACASSGRANA